MRVLRIGNDREDGARSGAVCIQSNGCHLFTYHFITNHPPAAAPGECTITFIHTHIHTLPSNIPVSFILIYLILPPATINIDTKWQNWIASKD